VVYPTNDQFRRAHERDERSVELAEREFKAWLEWERQQKEKDE
jgi:hypothetical protein